TYIWTYESGYIYLTSIMDLYSRKIIAWTLTPTMEVSCVVDTVNKAKASRPTSEPLIIHSDYAEFGIIPTEAVSTSARPTEKPQRACRGATRIKATHTITPV
ncbi:DDE-type integrase/transposase/recombinase, partial [Candidatus Weimeria sp. HCP3S3_B5]|uniref:DDE-type integrase/transposase/recombinase n=1 Tax=Candidatus Weimeria sp. HCP3S3_B5 TaxID=3438871 RepID=UPI003F8C0123